jgi:hypothetical protein
MCVLLTYQSYVTSAGSSQSSTGLSWFIVWKNFALSVPSAFT